MILNQLQDFLKEDAFSNYSFENFVSGSSNENVYECLRTLAYQNSDVIPLLNIVGDKGLGKTHLLVAFGREVLELSPDTAVCYYPAEELIEEIGNFKLINKLDTLMDNISQADVLLFDGFEQLKGDTDEQRLVAELFKRTLDRKGLIVTTSEVSPSAMGKINPDLMAVIAQGECVEFEPPDMETRHACVKLIFENAGIVAHDEAVARLTQPQKLSLRDACRLARAMVSYCKIEAVDLSVLLVEELLSN